MDAVKECQAKVIAAIEAMHTSVLQMYDATVPLQGTASEWRGRAIIEAMNGLVRVGYFQRAIDNIMDEFADRKPSYPPSFTRPQG